MSVPTAALIDIQGTAGFVRLAVIVVVLTALALIVNHVGQLGHGGSDLKAAARATLQLSAVGLIIAAVLGSWWLTLAFALLMLVVASLTSSRRITGRLSGWTLAPVAAGSVPAIALLLGSGLVPWRTIAVVPIAGILIGGAMTATTLAGKLAVGALHTRRGEYEAALSIGLESREAALLVARDDATLALVPGLDQTRTVGLVSLPGAFVGMLLGGASPLEAAAVQLVVLVALLFVQSVATVGAIELVARQHLVGPPAHVGP